MAQHKEPNRGLHTGSIEGLWGGAVDAEKLTGVYPVRGLTTLSYDIRVCGEKYQLQRLVIQKII